MINKFKSPRLFLEATAPFLEKRELENNLILGICNSFINKDEAQDGVVFINVTDGDAIRAASIKTTAKAIITAETNNQAFIKELADYYLENSVELKGVFGESSCVNEFSNFYGRHPHIDMALMVHKLTTVNKLPLATGKFEMANISDLDLITKWALTFEDEKNPAVRNGQEKVLKTMQAHITAGNVFKWTDKGNTVCIAAINRKTKNAGIIGLVYTPPEHRGNGYATSHVQKLSEYILQSGFNYCGLFTDQANPTSNAIYKKIGYNPLTEFMDIGFK